MSAAVDALDRHRRSPSRRPQRSFDPRVVGSTECAAWVAYYRRDWLRFARASVSVARRSFGLSWPATLACSWLIVRANQLWAPFPHNRPDRAQRAMERFYRIVRRRSGEDFDPGTAAALEVQWWRVHREHQHGRESGESLATAIGRLYAHVYGLPQRRVLEAAQHRALAMCYSDRWVADGCDPGSPLIGHVRDALVDSYASLLRAVTPAPCAPPTIPA